MKTLSIIIPVYNEETRLYNTFEALENLHLPKNIALSEIIFVDDGSTDATPTVIRGWKHSLSTLMREKVRLVQLAKNSGKGTAVKRGMLTSRADYTLFCDADISTPFKELSKFSKYMHKEVPVISGTRKNGRATIVRHQKWYRELLGRGFTFLSHIVLGTWGITDFTCGFKAFSYPAKETIFNKSVVSGWGFDAEALFLAVRSNLMIQEVAVVWSDDPRTKVQIWKAVPKSMVELVTIRLTHDAASIRSFVSALLKPSYLGIVKGIKSII